MICSYDSLSARIRTSKINGDNCTNQRYQYLVNYWHVAWIHAGCNIIKQKRNCNSNQIASNMQK